MNEKINLKFYQVEAKCGHVGKGRFLLKSFFVKAENGRIAAQRVRNIPRVKHDHRDAIKSVKEISEKEYNIGLQTNKNDRYFSSFNIQQQRMDSNEIYKYTFQESAKPKYQSEDRKQFLDAKHRFERKQNKYVRLP